MVTQCSCHCSNAVRIVEKRNNAISSSTHEFFSKAVHTKIDAVPEIKLEDAIETALRNQRYLLELAINCRATVNTSIESMAKQQGKIVPKILWLVENYLRDLSVMTKVNESFCLTLLKISQAKLSKLKIHIHGSSRIVLVHMNRLSE